MGYAVEGSDILQKEAPVDQIANSWAFGAAATTWQWFEVIAQIEGYRTEEVTAEVVE